MGLMLLAQAVLDQILNSLLAAGPLAAVLGVAVYVLWRSNAEERARHVVQEEATRREYLAAFKSESDRHSAEEEKIRAEYVETLKKLSRALRES